MDRISTKDIGIRGERAACAYLIRLGFQILDKNVAFKTGELDIVAEKSGIMHIVEVKTLSCREFPDSRSSEDQYRPEYNLHETKLRKVARTAEWYMARIEWEGEWQVDAALVWLRVSDGVARVSYLPRVL
jgi:putative endonuclease